VAKKKKTEVMDGFAVVRMVSQAKKDGFVPPAAGKNAAAPKPPPPVPVKSNSLQTPGAPPGRHFKTVQPPKWTLRCFECGYEFHISGRTQTIYCAKCRAAIDLGDYAVDGPWTRPIKTGGRVHIRKNGHLQHVAFMAGNITMEGTLDEQSALECSQWLEIGSDAILSDRQFKTHNLRLAAGATLKLSRKLRIHHLELFGTLEGEVEATGVVTIHDGGDLCGSVRGAHLQVEDGGGLSARVFIWPTGSA